MPKDLADDVARHLVMVARLVDSEPERAYEYAQTALRLASRVAAVREAAGFAAYATERYSEALAEFRAARRMSGSADLWPVMADCERGMGRPEKALEMAGDPEVNRLDQAGRIEMRLVAAGARTDMGQIDAAVVTLQCPELTSTAVRPWTARLRYAYADALLAAGREKEARDWFAKAADADRDGSTDAAERLAVLDGVEYTDALDPDAEDLDEVEDLAAGEEFLSATEAEADGRHAHDVREDAGEEVAPSQETAGDQVSPTSPFLEPRIPQEGDADADVTPETEPESGRDSEAEQAPSDEARSDEAPESEQRESGEGER
ncbi:tetratricopeptide (TPR) repeat protein [Allostreptomyces psammosilenae]|uniref:Tetratricopeptide (TPR) repeat protein n=2 Tax=Allostreptomyces psammosilenae TaxID=1892865 RepID=A0A852ZNT7_9ACTN|nr:tetratricopeptide (TPR) repeat protein [Allostreptomyces psammosilenae]